MASKAFMTEVKGSFSLVQLEAYEIEAMLWVNLPDEGYWDYWS